MRKWLYRTAVAALGLSLLAGCGTSVQDTAEGQSLKVVSNKVLLEIVPEQIKVEYKNDDSTLLLGEFISVMPKLQAEEADGAAQEIADRFNRRMQADLKKSQKEWDRYMDEDRDVILALSSDEAEYVHWCRHSAYDVTRVGMLASFRFEEYNFLGGAHGFTEYTTALFDMEQGEFVAVNAMTDRPKELSQAIGKDILRQIQEEDRATVYGYWEEYPDYVMTHVDSGVKNTGIAFENDRNLEIVFPAYELASYAAGPQEFLVGSEVWEPYLNGYGQQLLGIS